MSKQSKQLPTQQTTSHTLDETLQPTITTHTMVETDAWRYQSFSILRMQSSFRVSGCDAMLCQHMAAHAAAHLFFRLRHAQHGSSAAKPRRANFGRWRPQRRPFCRSDTHPLSRRSADPWTPISRGSDWRGGRSVPCARSLQTCDFAELSRERGTNSERPPHGHDPRTLFYRRSRELSG